MQTTDQNVPPIQPQDSVSEPLKSEETVKSLEGAGGVGEEGGKEGKTANISATETPSKEASNQDQISSIASVASAEIAPAPSNASTTGSVPPPSVKRFSSAIISKKFMEKATSSLGSGNTLLGAQSAKTPTSGSQSATGRPNLSNAATHPSRLVTGKLTTTATSSANSAGWNTSRPNSTASTTNPSPAQTPGIGSASIKQNLSLPNGKSTDKGASLVRSGSSGKPWGDVKKSAQNLDVSSSQDFPTAAEVARAKSQSRPAKSQAHPTSESAPSGVSEPIQPESMPASSSADAFRGKHLDPNVHHWDEDDDDDSDFLGATLQFGDGTLYSVPPTAAADTAPEIPSPPHSVAPSEPARRSLDNKSNGVVRKEDRFVDDFDRSWPRGHGNRQGTSIAGSSPRTHPPEIGSPARSQSSALHSDRGDRDRHLFNERSNRLEPFSSTSTRPAWGRRENEAPNGRGGARTFSRDRSQYGRDGPPPGSGPNGQGYGGNRAWQDRGTRRDFNGRYDNRRNSDMPPPVTPSTPGDSPTWGRDNNRRFSNASRTDGLGLSGTHQVPNRPSRNGEERDSGRPPLPHSSFSNQSRVDQGNFGSRRTSDRRPSESTTGGRPYFSHRRESMVSNTDRGSVIAPSPSASERPLPETSIMTSPGGLGLEQVTKITMHSAAERARLRRQEEEAFREAEKQRARAKAAAMEVKMREREEAAAREAQEAKEKEIQAAEEADRRKREQEEQARREAENARLEQEQKVREASERARATPADPLTGKPPSTSRPVLKLLPRSVPLPVPEVSLGGSVSPSWDFPAQDKTSALQEHGLPASAESEILRSLEHKSDNVEVIDFSNMATLMSTDEGVSKASEPTDRLKRPVASDFYDIAPVSPSAADSNSFISDALKGTDSKNSWKRTPPQTFPLPSSDQVSRSPTNPMTSPRRPPPVVPPSPNYSNRSFVAISPTLPKVGYKEASLSSLSETMSRFRGVLATMHPPADETKASTSSSSTIAPEFFAVTVLASPTPPPSAQLPVKLSKQPTRPPIPSIRARNFEKRMHFRMDAMSFDPPIEYISKKTWSRDELLVTGKSPITRVALPKSRLRMASGERQAKVHLPGAAAASTWSGFGRGVGVNDDNWRRLAKPPSASQQDATSLQPIAEINPVSRSPPPSIANTPLVEQPNPTASLTKEPPSPPTPSRLRGKVTSSAGYSLDALQGMASSNAVRFMVSSEIELPVGDTLPATAPSDNTAEDKASEETPSSQSASTLLTPPTIHATTAWSKSPLGFPMTPANMEADSERIKAVWDHPNSGEVNVENSLKGLADDFPATLLSAVPDIKSDDGDLKAEREPVSDSTASARPDPPISRRTLDPHRAFQMVPQSTANSSQPPSYQPMSGNTTQTTPTQTPPSTQTVPSPYLGARNPPLPPAGNFGPRAFAPPPPNQSMQWTQPSPYLAPATLSPRMPGPGSTGPSPPIPQGMWMPPQQLPPSQYNGAPGYSYMQPPNMPPPMTKSPMNPPNMTPPGGMGNGHSHVPPMNYSNSNPMNSMHSPAYTQRPPQPMMNPHSYNQSPVPASPAGYGMPVGAGRGMVPHRTGFDLPPPATSSLYPQMQNRFHTPGW